MRTDHGGPPTNVYGYWEGDSTGFVEGDEEVSRLLPT
jgi:hypothetical protein